MRARYLVGVVIFLVLCGWDVPARADTHVATSCSHAHVQAAVDAASDGDVVSVPAGDSTWTSTGSVNITLDGGDTVGLTIQGAGIDQTIIRLVDDWAAFYLNISAGSGASVRFTGLTIDGGLAGMGMKLNVAAGEGPRTFRVDHCKFTQCVSRAIEVWRYFEGLIDHNEFLDNGSSTIAVYGDGDAGWARAVTLGSEHAIYIEDNDFTYTGDYTAAEHVVTSNTGARYVFRYNTIDAVYTGPFHLGAPIDAHGQFYYGRGTVSYEIYNNTIDSEHSYRGMYIRGGTGVIFNNTLIGDFDREIDLANYQSYTSSGTYPACDTLENGTTYYPAACEYPAPDQIGRGPDLDPVDSVQDSLGLYVWNNTYNGAPVEPTISWRGYEPTHIVEDRDVHYSAMPGYTTYTYPHPDGEGTPKANMTGDKKLRFTGTPKTTFTD